MELTIFTPTYNRAHLLPRLYESLLQQTRTDFVWLVVDDGSTDATAQLISGWVNDNEIKIEYIYQSNGGKHRAHNNAVLHCKTTWLLCVDSDDYLKPTAVADMYHLCSIAAPNFFLSGIAAPREMSLQNIVKPAEGEELTLYELYARGFVGETSLLFKTKIVRQYLFPEINGEKFVTEAVVYDQLDRHYKLLWTDKSWVVCAYQEDGYTRNANKLYLENPIGWALFFNQRQNVVIDRKEQIVMGAKYICFSWLGHQENIFVKSKNKWNTLISLPLAIYYYLFRY